jgi:hypothetical protein
MVCSYEELIIFVQKAGLIDKLKEKQISISNELQFLKIIDQKVYWLKLNEHNIVDFILKMMNETERSEIHMSWLKERLLNIDSTFDQRLYGFAKMSEFSEMILHGTEHKVGKDKNNEAIIIINRI